MKDHGTLIGGPSHGTRVEAGRLEYQTVFVGPMSFRTGDPLDFGSTRYTEQCFRFPSIGFGFSAIVWESIGVPLSQFAKANRLFLRVNCDHVRASEIQKATGLQVFQTMNDETGANFGRLDAWPRGTSTWSDGEGGSYFGGSLLELGRMMEDNRDRSVALASLARSYARTFHQEWENIERGQRGRDFGAIAFEAARFALCPEACLVFWAASQLFEALQRCRISGPAIGVVVERPASVSVDKLLTGRPVEEQGDSQ